MEPQSPTCPVCHAPVLPQYYFCPNCGAKLQQAPLPTTFFSQFGLYIFSIILPFICFLFVTHWHGITYLKSKNRKEKLVGAIACILLFLSTLLTIYYAYVLTQQMIQSSVASINADF